MCPLFARDASLNLQWQNINDHLLNHDHDNIIHMKVFVFVLLSCGSSLCILDTCPLSDI